VSDPFRDRHRPGRLVVVAGTATEIGKTWVAAHLARDLVGRGETVAARKPAQSFDAGDRSTDAHVLGEATGEAAATVCPHHRWYEVPMAPPMAAEALGRPAFTVSDLAMELDWPIERPRVGLVETAGGVRSPLARDGDTVSLIEEVQPDLVVLVADAGLGTINAVRLAVDALDRGAHVAAISVFLNRFDGTDDLHRRNLDWLSRRDGLAVDTNVADLCQRVQGDPAQRP
jgi:dethiobiotin synthetase